MHMNNMGVYNRSISHGNQNNGATVIQIEDDHVSHRLVSSVYRKNSRRLKNIKASLHYDFFYKFSSKIEKISLVILFLRFFVDS